MKPKNDLSNKKFGRLSVINLYGYKEYGKKRIAWNCVCECGDKKIVTGENLIAGLVRSCGCLRRENNARYRHGLSKTSIHNSWLGMKARCLNKKNKKYLSYGGRGIKVCERWMSFDNFYKDMGNPSIKGMSIGRVDNDGNYEPKNCRWETPIQQANNRRSSKYITIGGIKKTLMEWVRASGLPHGTIKKRISRGWYMENILAPSKKSRGDIYAGK